MQCWTDLRAVLLVHGHDYAVVMAMAIHGRCRLDVDA